LPEELNGAKPAQQQPWSTPASTTLTANGCLT